jgi:hypothetical protein
MALLFLAFAVFGWGLQAKLELYKPASVQKPFVAKLLTERHLTKIARAVEQRDVAQTHSPVPSLALVFSFLLAYAVLQLATQEDKMGPLHPGKPYLHGIYSLNLPPPSLP